LYDNSNNEENVSLFDLAAENHIESNSDTFSLYSGINKTGLNVLDRSKITVQAKQSKINSFRQSKEREQLMSIKSNPETTKRAQQLDRSVHDMIHWEEERKAKLERKKQEILNKEESEMTGRPLVTKYAEKVSKKWKDADDHIAAISSDNQSVSVTSTSTKSVQERLWLYEEKKQLKLQKLQLEKQEALRTAATPKISAMAQKLATKSRDFDDLDTNMTSDTHVSQRLYALAQLKQQANNGYLENADNLLAGRLIQHDPMTGQRLFEVSTFIRTRLLFS
jgi:hypothetical protein